HAAERCWPAGKITSRASKPVPKILKPLSGVECSAVFVMFSDRERSGRTDCGPAILPPKRQTAYDQSSSFNSGAIPHRRKSRSFSVRECILLVHDLTRKPAAGQELGLGFLHWANDDPFRRTAPCVLLLVGEFNKAVQLKLAMACPNLLHHRHTSRLAE